MTDLSTHERERALRLVALVLNTPLMTMSPDYHEALRLAEEHQLSAADLLRWAKNRSRNV